MLIYVDNYPAMLSYLISAYLDLTSWLIDYEGLHYILWFTKAVSFLCMRKEIVFYVNN